MARRDDFKDGLRTVEEAIGALGKNPAVAALGRMGDLKDDEESVNPKIQTPSLPAVAKKTSEV
jgi:hypothetical protein